MSEEEKKQKDAFLRKVWLGVLPGIVLMVVSAILSNVYLVKSSEQRSLSNEVRITALEKNKADKGIDNGLHSFMFDEINACRESIKTTNEKIDSNQKDLILRLNTISDIILELHTKN